MSGTLDWIGIQGWNLENIWRESGATNVLGQVSGCLSTQIWEGYEWKGTFESIIFLYVIALCTNLGILGN